MKKLRLIFLAMFMVCLTLTGCQDSKIDGYWVLSSGDIEGQKLDENILKETFPDGSLPFLSFEENGKFVGVIFDFPVEGKWEATEKGAKITVDKNTVEFVKEGNKLILDMKEEKSKLEYTSTKDKPKLYDHLDAMMLEQLGEVGNFYAEVSTEETQEMSNAMNSGTFIVPEPKVVIGRGFDKDGKWLLLRYDFPDSKYEKPNKITLLDESIATRLVKDGDYIYYVSQKDNDRSIKRVKLDGSSEAEVLVKKAGNTDFLQKFRGRFYYKDENNHIVSVDQDFKDVKKVIEDTDAFYCFIVDGWMIYQDDKDMERIHARNIANGIDVRLTENPGHFPTIMGDYLYYTSYVDPTKKGNEFNLCRVNLKDYTMEGETQVFSFKEERSSDKKIADFSIDSYGKYPSITGGDKDGYQLTDWNKGKENMAFNSLMLYHQQPEVQMIRADLNENGLVKYFYVYNSESTGFTLPRYEK